MVSQKTFENAANDVQATQSSVIQPYLNFLHPEYQVLSKLGEGGHGAVFEVINRDHRKLALKVQKKRENRVSALQNEYEIYKNVLFPAGSRGIPVGFPLIYGFKEHNGFEYLFMERLGDSLDDVRYRSPGNKLPKPDVLMIGIQVICRLRTLHEKGILHRDIKPDNLVMGCGPNGEKTVHIIDFGVSSVVQDWIEYEYDGDEDFVGTTYYAPIEALYHEAPSRAGDLESLAYTLLFLFNGNLPWVSRDLETGQTLTDSVQGDQRVEFNAAELCSGFPELIDFVTAVSETQKAFEPDYQNLIGLLETALDEVGSQNNREFSWLQAAPMISISKTTREHRQRTVVDEEQTQEKSKDSFCEVHDRSSELVGMNENAVTERQHFPADQQQPHSRLRKTFILIIFLFVQWDHQNRRDRANANEEIERKPEVEVATPKREAGKITVKDTPQRDYRKRQSARGDPKDPPESNLKLRNMSENNFESEVRNCILGAEAHLHGSHHEDCHTDSMVEEEANGSSKRKDGRMKGRKRALLKQILSKGADRAIQVIIRPIAAFARRRCR